MSFDVRKRELELNQHILCEASAGTGKTFTIEHLFIRRLLTPMPNGERLKVRDLAILTFTRAVARELLLRLKRALDKAIFDLKSGASDIADYLIEKRNTRETVNWLEEAREEIDFALIGTIHSFCYRLLTEYTTGQMQAKDSQWATPQEIKEAIVAYFRQEWVQEPCKEAELKALLLHHHHDFSQLLNQIQDLLWKEHKTKSILELFACLKQASLEGLMPDQAIEELERVSFGYKNVRNKEGELKEGIYEAFCAFAKLFSKSAKPGDLEELIAFPLYASKLFKERKLKVEVGASRVLELAISFEPYIHELAHPDLIAERWALSCQEFVKNDLEERGLFCREVLIEQMEKAISEKPFVTYLRRRISCLIVDEFQDTDPRQWKIMSDLFLADWKGYLYLVGDPKQAIYSFRAADVYSYMQAKQIRNQLAVTLTANFRSSPDLVRALNLLFHGEHSGRLFYLPKLKESLEVPLVSSHAKSQNLEDGNRGAVHFFVAKGLLGRGSKWPTEKMENEILFAFIAKELVALKQQGIAFHDMAILIKDRFQAKRLESYLNMRGVSSVLYRSRTVVASPAHHLLCRLVKAVLMPRDKSLLVELLIYSPFTYSSEALVGLEDLQVRAEHVERLLSLKNCFEERGIAAMVQQFLLSKWQTNLTVKELLWEDAQLLRDMEVLVEYASEVTGRLETIAEYLFSLFDLSEQEKEQISSRNDPHEEAPLLMTLYASKGLEFDIVFGLALVGRIQDPVDPEELDQEKIRQFYVACTRAKRRLYLPCALQEDFRPLAAGTSSPMELFLASFGRENPLQWLVEKGEGSITLEQVSQDTEDGPLIAKQTVRRAPLLLEPLVIAKEPLFVESFTSRKEEVEYQAKEGKECGLPCGAESGILLHQLLYDAIKQKREMSLAERLQATLFQGHEEEVQAILQRALAVNLGSFSLHEVDLKSAFCEREFFFRLDEGRILRGCIDLAFIHEGVSYLLDWKSNFLPDYSEEALKGEMRRHEYDLQAKLYSAAWKQHLQNSPIVFGGYFLVFLRGLTDNSSQGVLRL